MVQVSYRENFCPDFYLIQNFLPLGWVLECCYHIIWQNMFSFIKSWCPLFLHRCLFSLLTSWSEWSVFLSPSVFTNGTSSFSFGHSIGVLTGLLLKPHLSLHSRKAKAEASREASEECWRELKGDMKKIHSSAQKLITGLWVLMQGSLRLWDFRCVFLTISMSMMLNSP